jgi:hypothetical protein
MTWKIFCSSGKETHDVTSLFNVLKRVFQQFFTCNPFLKLSNIFLLSALMDHGYLDAVDV